MALAVAACSGGGSAIPHAPPGGSPSHVKVKVKFVVAVPSARHRGKYARRISARLKHIWTVAENTAGIQIIAYAAGDRTTPLGTTVADISPTSSICTPIVSSSSYGGRACTLNLQAPPGNDDFVATTYDLAPVGGSIPSGANQLGYGVATQNIVAGTTPSVPLSVGGVLSKIALAVTPSTLHTIIPSTATLSVYGLDADNDVIVSNGYIDGSGNPVTVSFSVDNALPLVGTSAASLTFSPASITAPPPAGVTLTYAPTTNGVVASSTQTVNISASPSASTVTATGAVLKAFPPSFTTIADTNLNVANPYHGGMVEDNPYTTFAVYYSTPRGFGGISEYSGSGTSVTNNYAAGSGAPIKGGVAENPVGVATFYALTGTAWQTFSAPPSTTIAPVPNASAAPASNGSATAYDSSRGMLAYTSGTNLVEYNPASTPPNTYAIGTTTIGGIAIDTTNVLWIVDTANNKIVKEDTVNPATSFALQSGGAAFDVVDASNAAATKERLFVTDHSSSPAILEVNTSGSLVSTLALPSGTAPYYIAKDQAQTGIVWFSYLSGTKIGIGRLDMNGTTPKFLMATGPSGTAISGSVQAGAIGTSSDGHVYTVFDNASELVQWNR